LPRIPTMVVHDTGCGITSLPWPGTTPDPGKSGSWGPAPHNRAFSMYKWTAATIIDGRQRGNTFTAIFSESDRFSGSINSKLWQLEPTSAEAIDRELTWL